MSENERLGLFKILSPKDAAEIIEDIPEKQAAELVEEMPSEQAALIMEELDSDHLVDVLAEMDQEASQAILSRMDREDAAEARMMLEYPPDCAGGLMVSEFLAFRSDQTVQDVLDDLHRNRDEYADYHVQYFYVVDDDGVLVGVLRIHDLLFPKRPTLLTDIMIPSPLAVKDRATIRELDEFFEENKLFGAPVVDDAQPDRRRGCCRRQ